MVAGSTGHKLQAYADYSHEYFRQRRIRWDLSLLPTCLGFELIPDLPPGFSPPWRVLGDRDGWEVWLDRRVWASPLGPLALARAAADYYTTRARDGGHCSGTGWFRAARLAVPSAYLPALRRGDLSPADVAEAIWRPWPGAPQANLAPLVTLRMLCGDEGNAAQARTLDRLFAARLACLRGTCAAKGRRALVFGEDGPSRAIRA